LFNIDDGAAAPPTDPADDALATTIFNPAPQRPLDWLNPFDVVNCTLFTVFWNSPSGPVYERAWGQRAFSRRS